MHYFVEFEKSVFRSKSGPIWSKKDPDQSTKAKPVADLDQSQHS